MTKLEKKELLETVKENLRKHGEPVPSDTALLNILELINELKKAGELND